MLSGKAIIITGGSRGIGKAIVRRCAQEGAIVGLNYLASEESARSIAAEYGDRVRLLPFDVSDPEAVVDCIGRFAREVGRIDGLVNNAGVFQPNRIVKASIADIRRHLDVNLLGPIICTRQALPYMLAQHSGVILNISSVAAMRPTTRQAVYAASKAGLEAFTMAIATEYGTKGIRSVAIRLGHFQTDLLKSVLPKLPPDFISSIPLGRLGNPEEVADLAVFLMGDKATFITGSVHTIDGGYSEGFICGGKSS
ncbi:MAG: SDR family NAD(P)-dependent oxidoreductase [Thermoguttaceae bacterium]